MSISIHLITDNCPPDQIDRALLYVARVKPNYITIAGGAAFDVTMTTVERCKLVSPTTNVILRKLEDTGVWTRLNPEQWFNDRVAPRLDWCKKNNVIWLTDNESSGDDDTMKRYAAWQVDVLNRLHAVNLRGAVGRWATGNIRENQYALMKPMFDAMKPGDVFSPNEYLNAPGKSSGGHVFRYDLAWKAAGRELPTVIGEYGIAADYDAGKGYRALGLSGKDYASYLIGFYKSWYAPHDVTVCLYCVGGYNQWDSFKLDDSVFEALEGFAGAQSKPPAIIIPIPPEKPVEPPKPIDLPIAPPVPQKDPDNVIDLPPVVQSHTFEVKITSNSPTGDLMARFLERLLSYSKVMFEEFVNDGLVQSPIQFEFKEVK